MAEQKKSYTLVQKNLDIEEFVQKISEEKKVPICHFVSPTEYGYHTVWQFPEGDNEDEKLTTFANEYVMVVEGDDGIKRHLQVNADCSPYEGKIQEKRVYDTPEQSRDSSPRWRYDDEKDDIEDRLGMLDIDSDRDFTACGSECGYCGKCDY